MVPTVEGIKVTPKNTSSVLMRQDLQQLLSNYGDDVAQHLKMEIAEYNAFTLAVTNKNIVPNTYK